MCKESANIMVYWFKYQNTQINSCVDYNCLISALVSKLFDFIAYLAPFHPRYEIRMLKD